jgi:hypothetical protein
MKNCHDHSEWSEAERNAVEEFRGAGLKLIPRDPSTPLGMPGITL